MKLHKIFTRKDILSDIIFKCTSIFPDKFIRLVATVLTILKEISQDCVYFFSTHSHALTFPQLSFLLRQMTVLEINY